MARAEKFGGCHKMARREKDGLEEVTSEVSALIKSLFDNVVNWQEPLAEFSRCYIMGAKAHACINRSNAAKRIGLPSFQTLKNLITNMAYPRLAEMASDYLYVVQYVPLSHNAEGRRL